jgi:prevent-host-death family protein
MRSIGLFEAKQKLSELIDRARKGEKIGITRRGKLAAMLTGPPVETSLKEIFSNIDKIRKRARQRARSKGRLKIKEFIEEGRI